MKLIAPDFGISIESKTKRQLCAELAQVMCINRRDLAFNDVDINDPTVYKYKEQGNQNSFCFSKSDYDDYLAKKKQNPYNRQPINASDLIKMKQLFYPDAIRNKTPPKGFLLFLKEKMQYIKVNYRPIDRLIIARNMWNLMSKAERDYYNELAQQA